MPVRTIALMICVAIAVSLCFSMCSSGGGCYQRSDDDDDNDDSELADTCDEFCKNAFFCDLVPGENECYAICSEDLSYAFIECGVEADVVCEKFRECFDEYGDEFSGGDDDDGAMECDYEAPSVEEACDYPDLSFYAGELGSSECYATCESADDYGYLTNYDDLCGYCFCCGYEDLL